MDDLAYLPAARLAELIRTRRLSPVEVVTATLDRIERHNGSVNAFVTVCAERALDEARAAADAVARGDRLGPLHGVPIGVKDLDPVAGVRTTRGSRIFEKDVPNDTILCVRRLQDAGAIVVGKTNTPEFGYKATTDSTIFGPASTPFNRAMNAGGSSGGSAAAVAAGLVPLAQGSDAGGSLRVPGAFCGVFTLMPTFGRVAVPARPNAFRRLNPMVCYAPLTRTVEDAAIGLDLMSGPHPRDPYSFPVAGSLRDALTGSLAGVRVAYAPTLGGYPVEDEVDAIVRSATTVLAEAGADIEEVGFKLPLPHGELTTMWRQYLSLCHAETAEISREQGIDLTGELRHLVAPDYLESVATGDRLSAVRFRLADVLRTVVLDAFEDLFDEYDLLVSPVNCVTGVPNSTDRDTVGPTEVAGEPVDRLVGWSMTSPFNLIGSPAATVPAGRAANGVPVGLQIAARRFGDERVITACAAFERLRPWRDSYAELAAAR